MRGGLLVAADGATGGGCGDATAARPGWMPKAARPCTSGGVTGRGGAAAAGAAPPPVRMMLANEELRVVLVTIHLALRAAIQPIDDAAEGVARAPGDVIDFALGEFHGRRG